MIGRVWMRNFLAHKSTEIELAGGVNVLLGPNGAGKSSVVDAITYALFGRHSRGQGNANIPRRGARSGEVGVELSVAGRRIRVERRFGEKGQLVDAALYEITERGVSQLARGESRKGRAVSEAVAEILGMRYEDLLTAAVVRQGELASIVTAEPREFRDLLLRLTGLEKLQKAFENSLLLLKLFSNTVMTKTGYRPEDYERVKRDVEKLEEEVKKLEGEAKKLEEELGEKRRLEETLEEEKTRLEEKKRELEDKKRLADQLENLRRDVQRYLHTLRRRMEKERDDLLEKAARIRRLRRETEEYERAASALEEKESRLRQLKEKERELVGEAGRLRGLMDCGSMISRETVKCPVCGSEIPLGSTSLFDKRQLREHLDEVESRIALLRREIRELEREIRELGRKKGRAEKSREELEEVSESPEELEERAKLIDGSLKRGEFRDEYLDELRSRLEELEEAVADFSPEEYAAVDARMREVDGRLRAVRNVIERISSELSENRGLARHLKEELDGKRRALEILGRAYKVYREVEEYREKVYARNSPVSIALRSWLLEELSYRASDMLEAFQLRVQRVKLEEDESGVRITCHHDVGPIDVGALSGGERIALALALRLAVASLITGNVDFLILDEPTAHLDRERRQGFVRMMLDAFRRGLGHVSQLIIITHDSEVFEGAEVDAVYWFKPSVQGSIVERAQR